MAIFRQVFTPMHRSLMLRGGGFCLASEPFGNRLGLFHPRRHVTSSEKRERENQKKCGKGKIKPKMLFTKSIALSKNERSFLK
mmetsp:Transcript_23124/g.49248  ORF Transcript_23124/g.49248 Transcript_23124/m.49248 type:complete len:83 (-) Transcript_23124:504-752(-)